MSKKIQICVRLDAAGYRRYCAFDTFRLRRRWYWPAMISMVLITASVAGLLRFVPMSEGVSGVLMGLGLAIPMLCFGLYFIQIEVQCARLKLKDAPAIYTLFLSREGVRIVNARKSEAPVELPWDGFWAAFRRPDCIYLYATPERAFILPDGQADASPQAVWQMISACLGPEKCAGRRK